MTVFSVSLEWNDPPSEICGDPPCVGVCATREGAETRRLVECKALDEDGYTVHDFSIVAGRTCGACGEHEQDENGNPHTCANPKGPVMWCDWCGTKLNRRGSCDEDHDEWDVDVHVTEHQLEP